MWIFEYKHEFFITLIAFAFIIVSKWLMKYFLDDKYLKINKFKGRHDWIFIETISHMCRCSKCDILLIAGEGYSCSSCGLSCDLPCLNYLEQKVSCKKISLSIEPEMMKHHWIKVGTLLLTDKDYACIICGLESYLEHELQLQCCWCQNVLHEACKSTVSDICDFGEFRKFIVPPYCVQLARSGRIYRNVVLKSIEHSNWVDWAPVIVVTNRNSGGNDGSIIISHFRRILNPCQVIDLAVCKSEAIIQWCSLLPTVKVNILVAGGDGTVAWILSTIDKAKLEITPSVGIIPLGTGNDLSRVLGWGAEYSRDTFVGLYLRALNFSENIQIDRWQLEVKPVISHRLLRRTGGYKNVNFYNYFSVGVDAKVVLDFHQTRQSGLFYLSKTRLYNKLLYFCFGTQQAVDPDCKGLENKIELYVDGEQINLPQVESVIFLNISSWAAGMNLWKMCQKDDSSICSQKLDDGKLDIVALDSSIHIAKLRVGISVPYCIGQYSNVKIIFKYDIPVQVDGEPWIQQPAELNIKCTNSADVMRTFYFS